MLAPWVLDVPHIGMVEIRSPGPYTARPAKDGVAEWPAWYVAGPDGRRNVVSFGKGAVLCDRLAAETVAGYANAQR